MGSGQMMPELGSRISLISKADIRYEGRLFTVDPQECTIALANVRSFGTEDRDTAYPIMPQPTVYDYILFRGSDIKDIRVVNNVAIPNDPAIMQMQMNQQPGFPPQQQMQPGGGGGPMSQFGPFGNIQGPPMGQNIPPQPAQQQNQVQSSPQQAQQPSQTQSSPQQQQQSLSQQDSRSATPNQSRKSPTSDMGVQTSQQRENQGANKDKMQRNNNNNNSNHQRNNNQQQRRDNDGGFIRNQRMQQPNHHQQQQQQRGGYNNNKNRGSGRMPMMRGPPQPHQNNYRQNSNSNNNSHNNSNNNPQNNRQNKPPSKPLKFENEFDFEKANSKFEEIRSEFSKLKVGSEENKNPEQQVNGGEVEKKDDSGNETSADHDQQEGDEYNGYDKTKSFFDNISCEANERSKGKTQRTDWRQERKINSETFGLSMNRRGGMRGRGGYYRNQYGRPMNNYRGGGGGQQYRNNNNNRNRHHPQGGRTNINQGSQQPTVAAAADK